MNLSVAVAYSTIGPIAVAEINNPPVNAVNRGVRVGLAEALASRPRHCHQGTSDPFLPAGYSWLVRISMSWVSR